MVKCNKTLNTQFTKEEAALYDRQIRLWGVEAQQRLRKAKVLLVGLKSLGNEICKNIVLAGIQHLTLLDHTILTEKDIKQQFLSPYGNVGMNKGEAIYKRTKELNPLVNIVVDKDHIVSKKDEYFQQFDIVCMAGCCIDALVSVNEICHRLGIKFLCGSIFGYFGYMFTDLGIHNYIEEKTKIIENKNNASVEGPSTAKKSKVEDESPEVIEKTASFCTFSDALLVPLFENKSLKQAKQVSKSYLVMQVMNEYHERYSELPELLKNNEDFENLLEIRNTVFERLHIDNDLLDDEHLRYCFGELYPVNAVVGGVMSQEIIKAVSAKDAPHKNFFFYDAVTTSGVVESISPLDELKKSEEKPKLVTHDEILL